MAGRSLGQRMIQKNDFDVTPLELLQQHRLVDELARQLPPPFEVRVVPGADHFFAGMAEELCSIVVAFVAGD